MHSLSDSHDDDSHVFDAAMRASASGSVLPERSQLKSVEWEAQ